MCNIRFILLTLSLQLNFISVRLKECNQDPSSLCKCTFDDGGELDITSLGNSDNTPRFKDVKSQREGNYYSYNPCNPFSEEQCKDAAVRFIPLPHRYVFSLPQQTTSENIVANEEIAPACIINADKTQSITIGDAAKAAFKYDEGSGNVIVGYTSGAIKELRLTEIVLVCDKSADTPQISADGQQDQGYFQMTLTTVCACPDGCDSSGPKHHGGGGGGGGTAGGISIGSVICIVAMAVLIFYLVIGTLTMKFVKKKDGIEIIPNVTLWRSLPVLIKGGFLFVISKCRKRSKYGEI